MKRPALRIWNHLAAGLPVVNDNDVMIVQKVKYQPRQYTNSRLAELSLVVDTGGEFSGGEHGSKEIRRFK